MKFLCLLPLLATLVYCFPIEWQGNVSLSAQYPSRFTSLTPYPNGVYFSSLSLNISSVEGIYGSAYASGDGFPSLPPSWYLAFFESSTGWTGSWPINGSLTKASAYVGSTLLKLSEVNSTGYRFQTIDLSTLMWSLSNISSKNGLSYATFTGEISGDSGTPAFVIKVTSVVSSVVGILNSGVIMTPQCLGGFLEIINFPFLDANHSVELSMAFVTSTANVSTNDSIWLTSDRIRYQYGSDEGSVYYDLALNVMVYGDNNGISDEGHRKIQEIELRSAPSASSSSSSSSSGGVGGWAVTGSASLTDLNNNYMANQVKSMVNPEVSVSLKQITFPAGVHTLAYTTVIGTGVGPSLEPLDATTEVNKTFLAFLTVMGLLSVFLLASACGYFVRYRKELARGVEMKRQTYSPLEVE